CFFIRGAIARNDPRLIAVVGARAASDAGRRMARRLGLELAAKGFTVVSGLARGIDCEAHQGALDGGGKTVAVMGSGIDIVYPPENKKLADAMIENGGGVMSELPLGTLTSSRRHSQSSHRPDRKSTWLNSSHVAISY